MVLKGINTIFTLIINRRQTAIRICWSYAYIQCNVIRALKILYKTFETAASIIHFEKKNASLLK